MSESPDSIVVAIYARVPWAEVQVHRAKLAAAERKVHALGAQLEGAQARVYALEAIVEGLQQKLLRDLPAPGLITLDDLRDVLAEEAKRNGDDDEVRECLEWSDEDDTGHIEVVDTVRNLCSRVRALAENRDALAVELLRERKTIKGLIHDAEFHADSKKEDDRRLAGLVRELAQALEPLAPDSARLAALSNPQAALVGITSALIELPAQLVPEELANERRRRHEAEQAVERWRTILEKQAGLSPATDDDDVDAMLVKLCGGKSIKGSPARLEREAKAPKAAKKPKPAKQPPAQASLPTSIERPAWGPGLRLRALEEREQAGTIFGLEVGELAEMRAGTRCSLCGHEPTHHTPGCDGVTFEAVSEASG